MKYKILYTLPPVILLLLPCCSAFRQYDRPQTDVAVTDTVPSLKWREIFTDTCLQRLIDSALVHNADCNAARIRVEQTRVGLTRSRMSLLPTLSLQPDVTYSSASSVPTVYDLGPAASWEINLFGGDVALMRSAGASLEASVALEQAVRTEVICAVAESYLSLLTLDRQLEISQQTLESWDKTIQVLEALKLAGRSNDIAVLQAKAKMMKLQASTEGLKASIAVAEQALTSLVGIAPCRVDRLTLDNQVFPAFDEGIPVGYLCARPDIVAAEASLKQAFYATEAARADFYPSLKLSGSAGWTNYSGGKVFDPAAVVYSAAAGLVQPLLSRGTISASYKVASLEQEKALVDFRQSILDAGREVNEALAQCSSSRIKVALDREQAKALTTAVDKIELLMRYSTASYLEVLTAQQSLLDTELLLVQDQFSGFKGYISLYRALGGDCLEH